MPRPETACSGATYSGVPAMPPFQHDAATGVLRAHVSEQVTPPRELVADVPADVEAVILRCLAKRPEDRFRDARAVADALGACNCAAEWDEARAERWWSEGRMVGAAPSPVQIESLLQP